MESRTDRTRWVTWATLAILGTTCWVGVAQSGEAWFDQPTLRLPALGSREQAVSQALFESWAQRRTADGTLASATPAATAREAALMEEAAAIRRQIRQTAGE